MVDFSGEAILAPLTKGGNLPYRRLCVALGARITTSEMAYARQVKRGSRSELALLRRHEDEPCFGVQIATANPEEAVIAGQRAVERGAEFVDVNVGCPIHDVVRRGMGATLLKRTNVLGRIVEAMVRELEVPVTVKIRSGWNEGKVVALDVGKMLQEAGAAAVTLHARSREQRYTKAADWDLVRQLVEHLDIPVIGNGDILTHYEAREWTKASGCAGVMLARGALIKPWLFREIRDGESWEPTAEERVGLYFQLATFMKEHFRDDEKGRTRAMQFLPWHFDFFCRYRPLPESDWAGPDAEQPWMQMRIDGDSEVSPLEGLLRDTRNEVHQRISAELWDSADAADAVARLEAVAAEIEPVVGESQAMRTSNG